MAMRCVEYLCNIWYVCVQLYVWIYDPVPAKTFIIGLLLGNCFCLLVIRDCYPPSSRHLSNSDCLVDQREDCQNCPVLVVYCTTIVHSSLHTREQFLQLSVGLVLDSDKGCGLMAVMLLSNVHIAWSWCYCLQFFDTVGWASGRASGL